MLDDVLARTISGSLVRFGATPRRFSLRDRWSYLPSPKPSWHREIPQDPLLQMTKQAASVLKHGVVVWGHIVQANAMLFEPGDSDCPGELVYSFDPAIVEDPFYLQEVASELFSLKGTQPTEPELAPIAAYLTDETIRVFGLRVPDLISPEVACLVSTTFFVRKHLPHGRLCSSLFPIVVQPHKPHFALPLPARYWPPEFLQIWV